ncbi:hypothetical protein TREPR_3397 [Treponema primitia ZAS-2]|uniref:Outer membrane protein beta-barrel domain-containing protein n=1 Tax=Treponema primitia (strain ATCC BAA-887 / DSM 12427 / ZAS-2) TaxID=545694 RepID=F5YJL7_TREPZ|nr:hypothetical protein [Treponema primitia]AEF85395.1 hypothetical protein TREPR_3397 [Treponema primitia ZAS-2]
MKKPLYILLFLIATSAYSQHFKDIDDIYIAPPSGGTAEENDFFVKAIEMEISSNNHFNVVYSRDEGPWWVNIELTLEEFDDEKIHVVSITLMDKTDGHPMITQELVYEVVPEETYEMMPQVVFSILANIPVTEIEPLVVYQEKIVEVPYEVSYEVPADSEITYNGKTNNAMTDEERLEYERLKNTEWKNKCLYAGGSLSIAPAIYISDGTLISLNWFVPSMNIFAEGQVLDWLSLEMGFTLWYEQDEAVNIKYTGTSIPILLKFIIKPGNSIMIEPFAGTNFYFGDHTTSLKNLVAGLQFGGNVGNGVLFMDIRAAYDFEDAPIPGATQTRYNVGSGFTRLQFSIGLGYKLGFFTRPGKR